MQTIKQMAYNAIEHVSWKITFGNNSVETMEKAWKAKDMAGKFLGIA